MGMDAVAGFIYESGDWNFSTDLRYSYQSAVDKSADSYSFGQQIAYIAKHTVTADVKAAWKGYALNPRWVWKAGRSDSAGSLADWNAVDVVLSKRFSILRLMSIEVHLAAKNLLDSRYELVSGYPMPGRSFIGGITLVF
jgi:outer membrane cobalamin receptor